ncbi:PiggyBac transposable element-derived protein 3 [Pseudolycoriella hygida]|uniref:PiggyBac transposable element-derived protein 3 n=1 Tax=Pseudolycoriella hygida TaxID=35572 RepID=A0A9Q0S6L9_9DIPT|nr:PiggyBac transposable element-derived protein 3 [Pseudolycoriella hygida]
MFKRHNLSEILDNLDDKDVASIYIQPPENVAETTDDENDDEECNIISRKMLTLAAELKASRKEINTENIRKRSARQVIRQRLSSSNLRNKKTKKKNCDNLNNKCHQNTYVKPVIKLCDKSSDTNDNNKNNLVKICDKKSKRNVCTKKNSNDNTCKKNSIKWSKGGESIPETQFGFTVTATDINNMDATDYFELFFDESLLQLIIHESSQYCMSKNLPDVQLSIPELRTFMAILIVSGYNALPSKAMYWSEGKDLRNEAVYKSMRRDRFNYIMRSLHFASEADLDKADRFSKLRPIISH